eukprot:5173535-Prymnesium_polylepis.1
MPTRNPARLEQLLPDDDVPDNSMCAEGGLFFDPSKFLEQASDPRDFTADPYQQLRANATKFNELYRSAKARLYALNGQPDGGALMRWCGHE